MEAAEAIFRLKKVQVLILDHLRHVECRSLEEFEGSVRQSETGGPFVPMATNVYAMDKGLLIDYFAHYFDMLTPAAKLRICFFFATGYYDAEMRR